MERFVATQAVRTYRELSVARRHTSRYAYS
jgi:hypothetical protein